MYNGTTGKVKSTHFEKEPFRMPAPVCKRCIHQYRKQYNEQDIRSEADTLSYCPYYQAGSYDREH
jgi:hypothetical protein